MGCGMVGCWRSACQEPTINTALSPIPDAPSSRWTKKKGKNLEGRCGQNSRMLPRSRPQYLTCCFGNLGSLSLPNEVSSNLSINQVFWKPLNGVELNSNLSLAGGTVTT